MLTLVAVKSGSKYTSDHVNVAYDMATRNLRAGVARRYLCLTDDPAGLDPAIEVVPLPPGVQGWWAKLAMFQPGLFAPGERIMYMDLDIVITGDYEDVARYDGEFAILRDFYRPGGLQSAIMLWPGETQTEIWTEWEKAGRPQLPGGDQEWIEQIAPSPVILQEQFPYRFVSYKMHCYRGTPPRDARFVKFHGTPKPENCSDEWVQALYRVGGGTADDIELCFNASHGALIENIAINSQRDLPWLNMEEPHNGTAVIVGGGPSLDHTAWEIELRARNNQTIIALNGAARWLQDRGITPDWHVLLDARAENLDFLRASQAKRFLIASQCAPEAFDLLAWPRRDVTVWHAGIDGATEAIAESAKPLVMVSGGSTVGLSAMVLAYAEGFRSIHVFGMDSSLAADGSHHAYSQPLNDDDRVIDVRADGRDFKSTAWMVAQVNQFQNIALELAAGDAEIEVHGDGLLQHVAIAMSKTESDGDFKKIDGWWWPVRDEQCAKSVLENLTDVDEILKHVPQKRVVVQAGGNVGVWPARMADSFGAVYTFEPDDANYACLLKNAPQKNVHPFKAAVGARRGLTGLSADPKNAGAHYVREGGDAFLMPIDDLSLSSLDLICLDIEGYEMEALKGAEHSIRRHKPTIALEDKGLSERYGTQQGEAAAWLASEFGYKIVARCGNDVILRHGV